MSGYPSTRPDETPPQRASTYPRGLDFLCWTRCSVSSATWSSINLILIAKQVFIGFLKYSSSSRFRSDFNWSRILFSLIVGFCIAGQPFQSSLRA